MNEDIRQRCGKQLSKSIESFRLGMDAAGNSALTAFIDRISQQLSNDVALCGQQEIELINEIVNAQMRGDYIYIADLLEYRLKETKLSKVV